MGDVSHKTETCEQYNKLFCDSSTLKLHLYSHSGQQKQHKCHVCSYSNINLRKLKSHIFTHQTDKPYKCEQCNSAFGSANRLKTHTLIHTGEKSQKCNFCDYSCIGTAKLKMRLRKHTGENLIIGRNAISNLVNLEI